MWRPEITGRNSLQDSREESSTNPAKNLVRSLSELVPTLPVRCCLPKRQEQPA
jgi:hypothetical protein